MLWSLLSMTAEMDKKNEDILLGTDSALKSELEMIEYDELHGTSKNEHKILK